MSTKFDTSAIRKMVKEAYASPFATVSVKFALVSAWKAYREGERMEKSISDVIAVNPKLADVMKYQSDVVIAQKNGAYRAIENACNKVEKQAHKDNTAQAVKLAGNLWKVKQAEERAKAQEIRRANAEAKRQARAKLTTEAYNRIMKVK